MNADVIRAFGRTLAETQWLSPQDIRAYQMRLLSRLLSHARATTDFYAGRFDFDLASHDSIARNWSAIPILTRAEAVAKREQLISRSVPPEAGATSAGLTSGSTSFPFSYLRSEMVASAGQALTERTMSWWKADGRKALCRIAFDRQHRAPPPHGGTTSGWQIAHPEGAYHFLSTAADVQTQIQWLRRHKPAYLASYASLLKELALTCQKLGIRLKFKLLLSFGTLLDQETRDLCRTVFGAEILDTYGADEVGHIASQCPKCGEYHISAEATYVEILNSDGSQVRPGEVGRVIATPLYNYAMPLIRYDLGDLAELGAETARCGRGLPSLRRILGRYRNVFRFRDGKTAWPDVISFKLKDYLPLAQSQVIQLDVDHVEIKWVSDGRDHPIDLAALTRQVRLVLRQPVEVSIRKVDVIERSPSGKFEDCISLVPYE